MTAAEYIPDQYDGVADAYRGGSRAEDGDADQVARAPPSGRPKVDTKGAIP